MLGFASHIATLGKAVQPFRGLVIDHDASAYSLNGQPVGLADLEAGEGEIRSDIMNLINPWTYGMTVIVDFHVDPLVPNTDDFRVSVDWGDDTNFLLVVPVIRATGGPIGNSPLLFGWGAYEHTSDHYYYPGMNDGGEKRIAMEFNGTLMAASINGLPTTYQGPLSPPAPTPDPTYNKLYFYSYSGGSGGATDGATGRIKRFEIRAGVGRSLSDLSVVV